MQFGDIELLTLEVNTNGPSWKVTLNLIGSLMNSADESVLAALPSATMFFHGRSDRHRCHLVFIFCFRSAHALQASWIFFADVQLSMHRD